MNAHVHPVPGMEPRRERLPRPHAVEAEQAVLGGLMLRSEAWAQVCDLLVEEDFYRQDHRLIFRAIGQLAQGNQPCDAITLGDWFQDHGLAGQVGGMDYVIELATTTPSAANVAAYAEIVREKANLRRLIDVGGRLARDASDPKGAASVDVAARAAQALLELGGRTMPKAARAVWQVMAPWFADLTRRYKDGGGLVGHATPWPKLDAVTLGLAPGELVIVAARPSMGKSAFAVNLATHLALEGKRTVMFSLEMRGEAILTRAVAALGKIPLSWLRAPKDDVSDADAFWSATTVTTSRLHEVPFVIDDSAGLTADQITARAKREHLRHPITGAVIVDHLHLLKLRGDNIPRALGEATAALKALAKELGVPVVVLSQLNRSLETRTNKRPVMADLRESGAIEQDADLILFLHRDDYFAAQENRTSTVPGIVEVIVAKNREGEAGRTVYLRNALAFGRLDDCDYVPPERTSSNSRASVGFSGAKPLKSPSKPAVPDYRAGRDG